MTLFKSLAVTFTLFVFAGPSWAIGSFDPTKITDQATFDAFTKDLGAATSYKALAPTEPLGLLGFDIGAEITGTDMENINQWGDAINDDSLSLMPFPKLHLHLGLPLSLDIGLVYATLPVVDFSFIGGEIRYSFVSGNTVMPAFGIRASYSQMLSVSELELSSTGLELIISKGFLIFTPYGGIGNIWTKGDLSTAFDPSGSFSSSPSQFKWFLGLNMNLGLINFAIEIDKVGDANSYSGKIGFRF